MLDAQPVTKATFGEELARLVRTFQANEAEYTSPGYPEAQARTDFITPFFRALGWDVENRAGLPYTQREVIEEKGPGEGRPDYTFRIAGSPKFFVEAKPPHEDLDAERHVLQAKRYAWNTKQVFAVILTDFEEFRFYDASLEPDPKHPHHGLIDRFHLRYREYLDRLDDLWEFSPERVAQGSIEALLIPDREKRALARRKPVDVDDRFLDDMTRWRAELAKAVFKRNPHLNAPTLTEIVQRLLDRLIFIRVAEDRRIIEYRSLWECVQDWKAMRGKKPLLPMLNQLFAQVNADFNGDIFKGHPCEGIALHDWALGDLIEQLYTPRSPYRFDVIPVDIFGAVYERYLGKILRVRGKQVIPEDKPEVRKAGGVYYTPKYIVDYIVKNTVGKLIEGKTPKEIEKIRILDPACGSGSFLLGAFQCLIDYHVRYYEQHPEEASTHPLHYRPDAVKDGNGAYRLSIYRKAKILQNNLFGVDLDPQAVEITMMNLYLKALEGEKDLPQKQQLLPELKFNIRWGNSLIAPDIEKEVKLSEEERARLRPFDWHSKTDGFGDILGPAEGPEPALSEVEGRSRGTGFHAVIGNPPYVTTLSRMERQYLFARSVTRGRELDTFYLFVEEGVRLLCPQGRLGMILPNVFLLQYEAEKFRRFLLDHTLVRICDLGFGVFEQATVPSAILVVENSPPNGNVVQFSQTTDETVSPKKIPQSFFGQLPFAQLNAKLDPAILKILRKIEANSVLLKTFVEIHEGVHSGNIRHKLFFRRRQGRNPKKMLKGSDINRYTLSWGGWWVNYDPKVINRQRGEYASLREESIFRGPKIFSRQTADRIIATIDTKDFYSDNTLHSTKVLPGSPYGLHFLLGVLNSMVTSFVYRQRTQEAGRPLAQVKIIFVKDLPIPRLNLANHNQKAQHDKLVSLVDRMLDLVPKLRKGKSQAERQALQQQVEATDRQIDQLVYQLYGLTPDEIALVEQSFSDKRVT